MKVMVFTLTLIFSLSSFAEGLLGEFRLTEGKVSECPIVLNLKRNNNIIIMNTSNSEEMNGRGPFHNSLYFTDINNGWIVTESSSAGVFSRKTELLLSGSQASLKEESQLINGESVKRHEEIEFKVNDEGAAQLSYKIKKLMPGIPADSYRNITCQYNAN